MMEPGAGNYSFASQPQAVRSRSKFREPRLGADGRMAINIMWYLALSPWTARTNAAALCMPTPTTHSPQLSSHSLTHASLCLR